MSRKWRYGSVVLTVSLPGDDMQLLRTYLGYFIGGIFSVSGTRIGISAYGRQVIGIG